MSLAKVIAPGHRGAHPGEPEELAAAVAAIHPADLAELLDDLPREDRVVLFEALPVEQGAELLSELKGETLRLILHTASPTKLGPMLDRLAPDDVTDLLEHLTQRQREAILAKMSPRDAAEVERLQRYPPRTAGRLMTIKFATIRPEWTVAETLEHLKRIDPEVETVQSLYAVDDSGRLVGYVSAAPALPRSAGQEDRRHDGAAAPDRAPRHRPGRSRADGLQVRRPRDPRRRRERQAARHRHRRRRHRHPDRGADAGRPAPRRRARPRRRRSSRATSRSKPWRNVRLRFNWLLLLFVTETLTGTVLRHYEDELAKVVALSFFIPLLIGTGGNSGSQTVTTIVRGLAVGEIRLRDFGRVLLREGGSGLVLGILLGIVGFGRALLWGSTMPLALTVGVSILVICAWANTVGAMIPMLATMFKIDPTVMSAPLIATLVDATGLIIYFTIAKSFPLRPL